MVGVKKITKLTSSVSRQPGFGTVVKNALSFNWHGRARTGLNRPSDNHAAASLLASCIEHPGERDKLTGLPDRDWFLEHIHKACANKHGPLPLGLIVLKLSGLQQINAHFGYVKGDALLRNVAGGLSSYIGELDSRNIVARTGSAEFSFLVYDVRNETELSMLGDMLNAIVSAVGQEHEVVAKIEGHVGTALAKDSSVTAHDLLLSADAAMQEVRNNRAIGPTYGTPAPTEAFSRTQRIEADLQSAIENRDLFIVYQPQFDILKGDMIGMEALTRWRHPELGLVPPTEFIQAAERTGNIVALGRYILQTACEDAVAMRGKPTVSVNLSVLQFTLDEIKDFTAKVLETTGLPPSKLKLEVTESIYIENEKHVYETLSDLQAMGISISLDDFGTGYSALSYLTDFNWDELKIDRSFVSKAVRCDRARLVAKAIGNIAENMNAQLTVEGIETAEQRDLFASLGYTFAQGFLFAKPMPFADLNKSPYVSTLQ